MVNPIPHQADGIINPDKYLLLERRPNFSFGKEALPRLESEVKNYLKP